MEDNKNFEVDELRSALQKYIRRGMVTEAQRVALKLFESPKKGIVTNLFNRLAIISNEDIGVANPTLCYIVTRYSLNPDRTNQGKLMTVVKLLCESKKTRLAEEIWFAYGKLKDIAYNKNLIHHTFTSSDPLDEFIEALKRKDDDAFGWAQAYTESVKGKKSSDLLNKFNDGRKGLGSRTRNLEVLLWHALAEYLDEEVYNVLVEAYFARHEPGPFIQSAIMFAIHGAGVDANSHCLDEEVEFIPGEYVIHDYCVDKHTKRGREEGKGFKEFISEGMLVTNQDPDHCSEKFRRIYCELANLNDRE